MNSRQIQALREALDLLAKRPLMVSEALIVARAEGVLLSLEKDLEDSDGPVTVRTGSRG
jgi:hypothetical protein